MNRRYYILPEEFCKRAIVEFEIARDSAMAAKQALMNEYGCVAIMRRGSKGVGLAYSSPTDMSGFCNPKNVDGHYISKPKRNTIRGKEAQDKIDACCQLLEVWQWSLEKALGVYGVVSDYHGFHYLVAHPLPDGRVVLNAPAGKNSPRRQNSFRNFDDPVIPDCATEISESEFKNCFLV